MIYVRKTDKGTVGFGTIESKHDVEELFDKLLDLFIDDADDDEVEVDIEEDDDEDCECDDECEDYDGLPDVASVGYAHGADDVVIMNSEDNKWGLAEALLRAVAKTWPGEDDDDDELRSAFIELAEVARENLDPDD